MSDGDVFERLRGIDFSEMGQEEKIAFFRKFHEDREAPVPAIEDVTGSVRGKSSQVFRGAEW